MPLFIPTAPSISVSIIADVPITIQSVDKSLSRHVSATCFVYFKYSLLNVPISSEKRISQELTSSSLFFTIVLMAILSYCINFFPLGLRGNYPVRLYVNNAPTQMTLIISHAIFPFYLILPVLQALLLLMMP